MGIIFRRASLVRTYSSMPESELLLCMSGLILREDPMGSLCRPLFIHTDYFQELCPKIPLMSASPDLISISSSQWSQLNPLHSLYSAQAENQYEYRANLSFLPSLQNPSPVLPCLKEVVSYFRSLFTAGGLAQFLFHHSWKKKLCRLILKIIFEGYHR